MTTNRDLAAWGAMLGHSHARVVPGRRPDVFRGECGCGYTTTNRRTFVLAVDALIHHLRKVVREARTAGWQPPAADPGDTPSSSESPPRVAAGL